MSKASQPELKKFMDKKLFIHLQGGRKVSGTLRGYDLFLNLVLDDTMEETVAAQKHPIGTVCNIYGDAGVYSMIESCGGVGLPYHALAPALHSITRASHRFLTLATARSALTPSSSPSPHALLRQRRLNDLKDTLSGGGSPSRVWADYCDLLNVMGFDKLPLELHQQVLRHCTPTTTTLRVSTAKRLASGNSPSIPHLHEGRFQSIIRNMRASSYTPELDDYHFILEQFAAAGHHVGAMHVYKEIINAGITPQPKTFGLCLQAIAHRMQLPVLSRQKEKRTEETQKMMFDLVRDMRKMHTPFTSVNLDLTIRILKETLDLNTFEELMKWGYGIDLAYPDCPPLASQDSQTLQSQLGLESPASTAPPPQPFSTAALNTTIEILGRIGNVSKLVQAFEVLTNPLPRAIQHRFSSFDDDEDFGQDNTPRPSTWVPPHASPNTTSYIMMIRHLCRIGHSTLARHYVNEALHHDFMEDVKTRRQIRKYLANGPQEVSAPGIAVNRGTFMPIYGLSNRTKNMTLSRWLTRKLPRVLRRKKNNLVDYTNYQIKINKALKKAAVAEASALPSDILASSPSPVPSTSTERSREPISLLERSRSRKPQEIPIFDVDLDTPPLPSLSDKKTIRPIDFDLSVRVLQRDIEELEEFSKQVDWLLGRNVQRVKEALGRRVWAGKDIYLASENRRRIVTRQDWIRDVNFRRWDPKEASNTPLPTSRDRRLSGSRSQSQTPSFFHSNRNMKALAPQNVLAHLGSTSNGQKP
ncbi:hypothetical protein H0H92_004871 [Tricholoma furcatifolium]|nr:hypothetical protein H0H92_004871 [Tricholoma furcatifolium]